MFNKLRQNYKLSDLLIRIAFVLAYMFYSWQSCLESVWLVSMQYGALLHFTDVSAVLTALFAGLLMGVVLMFLVPFVTRLFLNYSRFFNVPRAEYALLAHLFCTIYFVICGALRMLNLITPLLLGWGATLFPFVASLCCMIWFYHVTSRLYFNDLTRPYYFRNLAIVYFVCAFVFEVLL